MPFDSLIRGKVALASKLTASLQPQITIKAWIGQDGFGAESYADPVVYHALVNMKSRRMFTGSGVLVVTLADIYILDPVAPNGSTAEPRRLEPIDPRDLVFLDDGRTAPIVQIEGFRDAGLSRPFFNTVTLGTVVKTA